MLAQSILAVLLPAEDCQNACLFALVGDVLADLVLGTLVSDRLCQSTFIYESIQRLAEAMQPQLRAEPWIFEGVQDSENDRLERFGLLTAQKKLALDARAEQQSKISNRFWAFVQYAYVAFDLLRGLILSLASSTALPNRVNARTAPSGRKPEYLPNQPLTKDQDGQEHSEEVSRTTNIKPILSFEMWATIQSLFCLDQRMPWLCGLGSLLKHFLLTDSYGAFGDTNSRLDR